VPRRLRPTQSLALLVPLVLFTGSCTDDGTGSITVGAASSLTESLGEVGDAFSESHPDIEVVFTFAASGDIVSQIAEGAPIDVFAGADQSSIDALREAVTDLGEPRVFAQNSLTIVTGRGNPHGIDGLDDLERADLIVVLADESVPLGRYTASVLESAGVVVDPSSLEQSAKSVLGKVQAGEADAAIVYVTDALAAGDRVATVPIPDSVNVTAEYPIVVLPGTRASDASEMFVEFVLSNEGRAILAAHGFELP